MSSHSANQLLAQAVEHHKNNRLDLARPLYEKCLSLEANQFDCLYFLGLLYAQTGEFQKSESTLIRANTINPGHAATLGTLGYAQLELKQHQAAIDNFKKAIQLQPNLVDAHYNLGNALQDVHQHHEAIESYNYAIKLQPNNPSIYFNKANSLRYLREFAAAIKAYDQAIDLEPKYAEAYSNKAGCLEQIGQYQDAITACKKALAINPNFATAHWNLCFCYLLLGNFENGWREHEWRWLSADLPIHKERRHFDKPLWLGQESLTNKTILLYAEQGLGDTLQFCRFVSQIKKLGAKVILEVQAPLVLLLSSLEGVDQVISKGNPLPKFDFQCPLMSLPLALKTTLEEIQTLAAPYLHISPERLSKWIHKLGNKTKPRVGIVWAGNPEHHNDWNRSIPLEQFLSLTNPAYQIISLQKTISPADQILLSNHPEILHFGDELQNFEDTAALCTQLDLVITVDTSIAHLAGGLGKEVWVLLPTNPDWRWLLNRTDSPWYPSAKLYRQDTLLHWVSVLEQAKTDLAAHFSK